MFSFVNSYKLLQFSLDIQFSKGEGKVKERVRTFFLVENRHFRKDTRTMKTAEFVSLRS